MAMAVAENPLPFRPVRRLPYWVGGDVRLQLPFEESPEPPRDILIPNGLPVPARGPLLGQQTVEFGHTLLALP